jgi:sRNA-binding protein
MASPHTIERQRGAKEAGQQVAVLREKWPLAFPVRHQDVRPLALGTVGQIAEAMGWSVPYTIGVLTYWKMAPVYCQAVLAHDRRITLDGPAEPVDAEAKELATKQLAKLAARSATKQAAAAKVKPKRKPAPTTEKSTPLRDRVRAGLLRRRT